MKSAPYISLDKNSQKRIDARNTIIYSLFLEYPSPDISSVNDQDIIQLVTDQCKIACSKLLLTNGGKKLNFFGDSMEFSLLYLHLIDYFPPLTTDKTNVRYPDIPDMILQHCLFSSYHAVVTELFHKVSCTTYQVINKVKRQGIDQLYKRGYIGFDNNNGEIHINKKVFRDTSSTNSTNFSNKLKCRNKIDYLNTVFKILHAYGKEKYNIATANILYDIVEESDTALLKKVFNRSKEYSPSYSDYSDSIQILYNKLYSMPIENYSIDNLYRLYVSENLFNFHMNYTVLIELSAFQRSTGYSLFEKDTLETIFSIRKLPNVYSRSYFLRHALENLYKDSVTSSYRDYWLERDRNYITADPSLMISHSNKVPEGFHFRKWLDQFKLFIDYLADFIIPIYDWCFICLLLDTIEKKYPDLSHMERLRKTKDLLAEYIYNNKESIVKPILVYKSKPDPELEDYIKKNRKIYKGNKHIEEYDRLSMISKPDWITQKDREEIISNWGAISDILSTNSPNTLDLHSLAPSSLSINHYNEMPSGNTPEFHKFYIELFKNNYIRI